MQVSSLFEKNFCGFSPLEQTNIVKKISQVELDDLCDIQNPFHELVLKCMNLRILNLKNVIDACVTECAPNEDLRRNLEAVYLQFKEIKENPDLERIQKIAKKILWVEVSRMLHSAIGTHWEQQQNESEEQQKSIHCRNAPHLLADEDFFTDFLVENQQSFISTFSSNSLSPPEESPKDTLKTVTSGIIELMLKRSTSLNMMHLIEGARKFYLDNQLFEKAVKVAHLNFFGPEIGFTFPETRLICTAEKIVDLFKEEKISREKALELSGQIDSSIARVQILLGCTEDNELIYQEVEKEEEGYRDSRQMVKSMKVIQINLSMQTQIEFSVERHIAFLKTLTSLETQMQCIFQVLTDPISEKKGATKRFIDFFEETFERAMNGREVEDTTKMEWTKNREYLKNKLGPIWESRDI